MIKIKNRYLRLLKKNFLNTKIKSTIDRSIYKHNNKILSIN